MVTKKLIKSSRTVRRLIQFIDTGGIVANSIKAHFSSYCDCDVVAWLTFKIESRDPYVFSRLLLLLRAPTMVTVDRVLKSPPSGKLLDRYCDEGRLMARYSLGGDDIEIAVLDESSSVCPN